jgi:anti-sigma factor RsiW
MSSPDQPAAAPIGEDDLIAYVDGELPAARHALVEQWLAKHPADRERVRADAEIRRRLAGAIGLLGDVPLPEGLRVAEIVAGRRARLAAGMRRLAAVLALLAVGAGSGWLMRGASDPVPAAAREVAAAAVAHRVFVAEKLHPVEVSAARRDHLGTWLGNRLGRPISIPDLSAEGLTLMGGRLLPGGEAGPAGQLMYETATGERVTLYLQSGYGDETDFIFDLQGDVGTLAWRSPDLAYVLSGPADRAKLLDYAHAIHTANL